MKLSDMTAIQLARLYDKLHARMTYGMGYQAFGYDWPTLIATRPALADAMRVVMGAMAAKCAK